jgi:hypothetical protein
MSMSFHTLWIALANSFHQHRERHENERGGSGDEGEACEDVDVLHFNLPDPCIFDIDILFCHYRNTNTVGTSLVILYSSNAALPKLGH